MRRVTGTMPEGTGLGAGLPWALLRSTLPHGRVAQTPVWLGWQGLWVRSLSGAGGPACLCPTVSEAPARTVRRQGDTVAGATVITKPLPSCS